MLVSAKYCCRVKSPWETTKGPIAWKEMKLVNLPSELERLRLPLFSLDLAFLNTSTRSQDVTDPGRMVSPTVLRTEPTCQLRFLLSGFRTRN